MSEAIKGFGDRARLSVSGVFGGQGDTEEVFQNYHGVSAMLNFDQVDGDLIVASRVGLAYARVEAERSQDISVDLEGEPGGWEAPETLYYTVITERTEADRLTPRAGLGLGWMWTAEEGGLGVQAVFDAGYDFLERYWIEQYPNKRVNVASNDDVGGGLSLRAGAELLLESYWWGEKKGPGIGMVFGWYWAKNLIPIPDEGQGGMEGSVGLLISF